jgi:16S rRNA (cytosine967-C5)-methyltransferase
MSLATHYIQTASALLQNYKGEMPFAPVLKQFFAQHKKYGSRDRKTISHLCYSFFRLGKALQDLTTEERILVAIFYCGEKSNPVLRNLRPEWDAAIGLNLDEKQQIAGYSLSPQTIFPWINKLNDGIDPQTFAYSHLRQPQLFLRIRPGFKNPVLKVLDEAGLQYQLLENNAVALPNASSVDSILQINKQVVVQDYSSQQTGTVIQSIVNSQSSLSHIINHTSQIQLWDCCAASGGKSIMMYDLFPDINITVSDIRQSILHNLSKRFAEAGIKKYQSFVADISGSKAKIPNIKCQLLLADVPCTGSGTWARTPEQLYFFTEEKIDDYAAKQFAIVNDALPALQKNGLLLYITCSVFAKENDSVVAKLVAENSLQLIHSQQIEGAAMQADSMFVAVMKKI